MTNEKSGSSLPSRRDALKVIGGFGVYTVTAVVVNKVMPWLKTSTVEASSIPGSKIINGVETYGDTTPLNTTQLNVLKASLNNEFLNGITEMRTDTAYLTIIRRASEYNGPNAIHEDAGDPDLQTFYNRHTEVLSTIVIDSNVGFVNGVVLRRLIIIEDNADWINIALNNVQSTDSIADSDAVEGLWFYYPYKPSQSGYWNPASRIDRGWIHEMGHYGVPGMPDFYSIEVDFSAGKNGFTISENTLDRLITFPTDLKRAFPDKDPYELIQIIQSLHNEKTRRHEAASKETNSMLNTTQPLVGIPSNWQKYLFSLRNDRGGIWSSDYHANTLDDQEAWLVIQRFRQGKQHDPGELYFDASWDFSIDVAPINTFIFTDEQNPDRWKPTNNQETKVRIYRTHSPDGSVLNKQLMEVPVFEGILNGNSVKVGNPFENADVARTAYSLEGNPHTRDRIPNTNALLLVRLEKTEKNTGNVLDSGFIWVDINDLLVGNWEDQQTKPSDFHLGIEMNVADGSVDPANFDWTRKYYAYDPESETFIPFVSK